MDSGLGVAVAGEAWDAASGTIVRNVRDSAHVTFGAALNATTLQGSDFQVDGIAPVGLVFPNLDVGAAGNNTGTDLRDNLFLTLGSDLTLGATPTVEIVGSIRDLAASELTLASVTASSGIDPAADLSVTKAASQASVTVGQDITYTVTIGNSGPETSTGVILTDPLSAGLTFVSATSTQGTCTESSGIVTCDLGTLGVGASATVTVVANVSSVVNTASVSSDVLDPNVTNNAATQTTPLTIPTGVLTASQWALMIMAVAFGVLLVWRRLLTSREEA